MSDNSIETSQDSLQLEKEPLTNDSSVVKAEITKTRYNSGALNDEELSAFINAFEKYKWNQWEKMTNIVRTRSLDQIENNAKNFAGRKPARKSNGDTSSQLRAKLHIIAKKRRVEFRLDKNVNELGEEENLNESVKVSETEDTSDIDGKTVRNIWSTEEIELLLKGMTNHRWSEWLEISKFVKTRTPTQVEIKVRNVLASKRKEMPRLLDNLKLIVTERKREYDRNKASSDDSSVSSRSLSSSSAQSESSVSSSNLSNSDFDRKNTSKIDEGSSSIISASPTNHLGDQVVVMEEGEVTTAEMESTMSFDSNSSNEKTVESGETLVNNRPVVVAGKRARKPRSEVTMIPSSPPVAKVSGPSIAKKRTYTRKNRTFSDSAAVSVNVTSEEVSILSSSSSGEFDRQESINIMSSSSSSSSSNGSLPSSTLSKSSKTPSTNSSTISTSDSNSSNNSVSSIQEWEKIACPAIFENSNISNPEKTYSTLKRLFLSKLAANPDMSEDELFVKLRNSYSIASLKQLLIILQRSSPTPLFKPSKQNKTDDEDLVDDYKLLKTFSTTLSGRRRKIRSEEGDWIDPNEIEGRVISHEPATPLKEKRKRKYVKKLLNGFEGDELSTTEDPFRLIMLNDYDGIKDHKVVDDNSDDLVSAPFRVEMCSSVILLMDLHSHLHSSEIIGLLGGVLMRPDSQIPVLKIDYGYPCLTAHSTGTQVDVDPLSEMEAGEFFESKNVRMTGWYHSHPNFEPNPSLRDLETQTMYQGLFKNSLPDSDIEPFVGVIVNPYLALTESSSHVECFYVAPNPDPIQERLPYRLPIITRPFHPEAFPQILDKMEEIVRRAATAPDRLDMQKNAEPGVKRIEKLLKSLQFHGDLTPTQMDQIKELFK